MVEAKKVIERLSGMGYKTPAQAITWAVRKYAQFIGDDDTAKNFTTAGMEHEEAIEIAVVTIEYLARLGRVVK